MGKMILTDAHVEIDDSGGTLQDISDHVRSVTITYSAELQDATAMGAGSRQRLAGFKDWSATLELYQDYDGGSIDDILFGIVGKSVSMLFRPTSASVGANNPEYTGEAFLENYSPIDGDVSSVNTTGPSFQGDGLLSRAVA